MNLAITPSAIIIQNTYNFHQQLLILYSANAIADTSYLFRGSILDRTQITYKHGYDDKFSISSGQTHYHIQNFLLLIPMHNKCKRWQ